MKRISRVALLIKGDLAELNRYLGDGWTPTFVSAQVVSSGQVFREDAYGGWLVILEKYE